MQLPLDLKKIMHIQIPSKKDIMTQSVSNFKNIDKDVENNDGKNEIIQNKNMDTFVFYRTSIYKNLELFNRKLDNNGNNKEIEKINIRNYFKIESNTKKDELPAIKTSTLKENPNLINNKHPKSPHKIHLYSTAKHIISQEDHLKFMSLLKRKNNISPIKSGERARGSSDYFEIPTQKFEINDLEKSQKNCSNEKIPAYTFDQITQKLEESKNFMLRDLHILKEMKLTQDLDVSKANLSNFKVSRKEEIMNFIKRKKREYNNMNFDYNIPNMNERIRKKFQKTVYIIMDKLSKLKLSFDEVSYYFFMKTDFIRSFQKKYSQNDHMKDL